jgi:hypothetical protein
MMQRWICSYSFLATIVLALSMIAVSATKAQAQNNIFPTPSGNVGIGTTNPGEKIEVVGNIKLPATATATADNSYPSHQLRLFGSGWATAHGVGISRAWDFRATGKYSTFGDSDFGLFYNDQSTPALYILGSDGYAGNVGIGTITPDFRFVVSGANGDGIQVKPTGTESSANLFLYPASGTSAQRNWVITTYGVATAGDFSIRQSSASGGNPYTAGIDRFYINGSGNVGIGTTAPGRLLSVSTATDGNGIEISTTTAAQSPTLRLNTANTYSEARNWAFTTNDSAWGDFAIKYSTAQGGDAYTGTTAMTVLRTGNVGIGTPGPGEKLEVNGNLKLTGTGNITAAGTISAKYQDVAEWVPASAQLAVGTVVVLDSTKSNQVTSSSVSYDTRVAGVISEQPGIALGEKSENKVLVATTGRVRVKVDASKGPIHVGDLLVTSDVSGVAMKSEPVNLGGVQLHRPGTLIGKALEPLEKGQGEILVLLSLQ